MTTPTQGKLLLKRFVWGWIRIATHCVLFVLRNCDTTIPILKTVINEFYNVLQLLRVITAIKTNMVAPAPCTLACTDSSYWHPYIVSSRTGRNQCHSAGVLVRAQRCNEDDACSDTPPLAWRNSREAKEAQLYRQHAQNLWWNSDALRGSWPRTDRQTHRSADTLIAILGSLTGADEDHNLKCLCRDEDRHIEAKVASLLRRLTKVNDCKNSLKKVRSTGAA